MLTKGGLDDITKKFEEIDGLILKLTQEKIGILTETRKELLELMKENNRLFIERGEMTYEQAEMDTLEHTTEDDIETHNIERNSSDRWKKEWIPTIHNLLDDSEKLKETEKTITPITTVTQK